MLSKTEKAVAEKTAAASQTPKRSAAASVSKRVLYIGPTIAGVVIENTVYTDGIPAAARDLFGEVPEMRRLFIPLLEYPEASAQIRAERGEKFLAYRAVREYRARLRRLRGETT